MSAYAILEKYGKLSGTVDNPFFSDRQCVQEIGSLFKQESEAQKIVIDEYIAENKKLKEALKTCIDDLQHEGIKVDESILQLLKE